MVWHPHDQEHPRVVELPSPQLRPPRHGPILATITIAAAGGLLFGYDTAIISGALIVLRTQFSLTSFTEGITVCAVLFGAMLGSLLGGKLSDLLGRRQVLMLTAGLSIWGTVLTACSTTLFLFTGCRVLVGLCIGINTCVLPVYLAEMAPTRLRGMLVTVNQFAVTIGIALAYWVGLGMTHLQFGWQPLFLASIVPALLLFIGAHFNTETPRWLASQGRWNDAKKVLHRLAGTKAEYELSQLRSSLHMQQRGRMRDLLQPGIRTALLVAVGLGTFQQLVGINTVIYYAPTIFSYAGFTSASIAILATGVVGIVNALATIVASQTIDRIGRRPLLLGGIACMGASLTALGAIFALGPAQSGYLTLVALLIYIMAFALSIGPVFWLLNAEVFPTRLRALGSSIATFANWSTNLLVSMTFLTLIDLFGKPLTFWLYAALGLLAFAFCWFLVPETRNKSLEQIELYWRNGRRWETPSEVAIPETVRGQPRL